MSKILSWKIFKYILNAMIGLVIFLFFTSFLLVVSAHLFDNSEYRKSKNEVYEKIIKKDFNENQTKLMVYETLRSKYKNFNFRPNPVNNDNKGYFFVDSKPQKFKHIEKYFSESTNWYVYNNKKEIICELIFNGDKLANINTIKANFYLMDFDPCSIKQIGMTYNEISHIYLSEIDDEHYYFDTTYNFKKWPKKFDNNEYYLVDDYDVWVVEGTYNNYFPTVGITFHFDKNKKLENIYIGWQRFIEF